LVIVSTRAPVKEDGEEDDDDGSRSSKSGDDEKDAPPAKLSSGAAASLDKVLDGALTVLMDENFKAFKNGAKLGSTTPTLRVVNNGKSQRYAVLGLGVTPKEGEEQEDKGLVTAGHVLGKTIATKCDGEKKASTVQVVLPAEIMGNATVLTDLSASLYAALYSDNRYRGSSKKKLVAEDLRTVTLVCDDPSAVDVAAATRALEQGKMLAKGILLAKDIVNAPHNVLNSVSLADTAKRIAAASKGRLTCTILGKAECEKRGMGAYLGVARGSETEPQFIHITYTPPDKKSVTKKVGIVGKGLLFDTGGYNIKTTMMEMMKFDCGGSAAVLGAALAIAALEPPGVEAHFIVAACENMIDARAYVPSDILTASNGKTIEVLNTDAEGRLTLADALVYADKEVGCDRIIELSTLTGACMISLGKEIAGVWTTNDELATEIADISKVTGDKSWRMPMESSYNELLESKFADLKNIGTRYGGAITAALFLQNFVNKKKPFAHIDIAGPVWSDKLGATGYGARLVVEWVRRQGLETTAKE
jgi:leucyl aminopeptidase